MALAYVLYWNHGLLRPSIRGLKTKALGPPQSHKTCTPNIRQSHGERAPPSSRCKDSFRVQPIFWLRLANSCCPLSCRQSARCQQDAGRT